MNGRKYLKKYRKGLFKERKFSDKDASGLEN